MQLKIKNCNNIENGEFDITEGRLNIKYAINGTGKSTISKAIEAFVTNDQEKKNLLLPFKYYGVEEENSPELIGYDQFKKVSVFNEKYIEDYVYQQNELIKNSFEIFVKSPDYDTHIKEIEKLLESINITFQNHPELEELIKVFQQFIDGFGKAKSGYSAAGAIGKGIGKGNKLDNIPVGLEVYEPYLKNNDNVKWIKWQLEGKHYLDMAEQCPYCSGSIKETKETILKVSEEYDAKAVEQLTKMLIKKRRGRDIPLAPLYGCVRIDIKAPAVPLMSHIREQRAKARKFLHEGRKRVQFTSLCVRVKLTLEIRHLQPLEKEGNGRECSRDGKKKRRYEEQPESVTPHEQP